MSTRSDAGSKDPHTAVEIADAWLLRWTDLAEVNAAITAALEAAVRQNQFRSAETQTLLQILLTLGATFPRTEYSVALTLTPARGDRLTEEALQRYGASSSSGPLLVAPPLLETTGTYGSGERAKHMAAVKTLGLSFDYPGWVKALWLSGRTSADADRPETMLLDVDLYGRAIGLPPPVDREARFSVELSCVTRIEVVLGVQWTAPLLAVLRSGHSHVPTALDLGRESVAKLIGLLEQGGLF